jgi:hypothetical protein
MQNIDVILMVISVVICVIGMLLAGTFCLSKSLDRSDAG